MMIRFLQLWLAPWLLAAFVAVVLVKWRLHWHFAASTMVRSLSARTYRASIFRRLPFAAMAAALLFIGAALLQPVIPFSQAEVQSRGLDVVILLDLSSSMQEEMGSAKARTSAARTPARGRARLGG